MTSLQLTSPVLRAADYIPAARNAIRVPSGASHAARLAIAGQPPIIHSAGTGTGVGPGTGAGLESGG